MFEPTSHEYSELETRLRNWKPNEVPGFAETFYRAGWEAACRSRGQDSKRSFSFSLVASALFAGLVLGTLGTWQTIEYRRNESSKVAGRTDSVVPDRSPLDTTTHFLVETNPSSMRSEGSAMVQKNDGSLRPTHPLMLDEQEVFSNRTIYSTGMLTAHRSSWDRIQGLSDRLNEGSTRELPEVAPTVNSNLSESLLRAGSWRQLEDWF